MVAFGGIMVAIGWAINAAAESLSMLYLGSALAGIGRTVGLHCFRCVDLPNMGRNIQSISLNLHRQLWHQIRDGKSQSAVHGKRYFGLPRSGFQRH
jgi:hypothetical protein